MIAQLSVLLTVYNTLIKSNTFRAHISRIERTKTFAVYRPLVGYVYHLA